jgi:hypothetical protein
MDQIPSCPVWLGHIGEGRDYPRLLDAGIRALVQLAAEEPPLQPPRELIYARFPLIEGSGNPADLIELAVESLVMLIRLQVPTLVCCSFGLSRSPAIAAAALALDSHESPEESLKTRVPHRHHSDISPGFWKDVVSYVASRS